jgi:hypothetical protein
LVVVQAATAVTTEQPAVRAVALVLIGQAERAPRAKAMQAAMGSVVRRAIVPRTGVLAVVVVQVRQARMEVVFPQAALTLETAETELSGPPVAVTTTAAAAAVASNEEAPQRVVPAVWVVVATVALDLLPDRMV